MHIDITRDTFRRGHQFARVLMLQGRVQLDADWNEQVAILWDYLRTLTTDLVGAAWGPGDSYFIRSTGHDSSSPVNYTFEAAPGTYYVYGLLTRNPQGWRQPPLGLSVQFAAGTQQLIRLRVRERLVTSVEDDLIREVALRGADTTARTCVLQQLNAAAAPAKVDQNTALYYRIDPDRFRQLLGQGAPGADGGGLRARVRPTDDGADDPCIVPADARYRGLENQLYRVEICKGGTAADKGGATFLWSRDNGSVLARWIKSDGPSVVVEGVGREGLSGFAPGQWVQLLDDDNDGVDAPALRLAQLQGVTRDTLTFVHGTTVPPPADSEKHPKVRRWDSRGDLPVQVPSANDGYLALEEGIEVKFEAGKSYTPGDYWLIPARTALGGGIEWPPDNTPAPSAKAGGAAEFVPALVPARRPESYDVPLAYVSFPKTPDNTSDPLVLLDLRKGPHGPPSPEPLAPPKIPDAQKDVTVPPGAVPLFRLLAGGVVVYKTVTDSGGTVTGWDAGVPRADLFDEQGQPAGILYKGQTDPNKGLLVWCAPDRSQVAADLGAADTKIVPAPDKTADLGWFLAGAKNPSGLGLFVPVKLVQQVFTVGGQAPQDKPARAGDSREQPFLATYYFYKT